jgi:hypothetical protein
LQGFVDLVEVAAPQRTFNQETLSSLAPGKGFDCAHFFLLFQLISIQSDDICVRKDTRLES